MRINKASIEIMNNIIKNGKLENTLPLFEWVGAVFVLFNLGEYVRFVVDLGDLKDLWTIRGVGVNCPTSGFGVLKLIFVFGGVIVIFSDDFI